MKKILSALSIIGASAIIVGCSASMNVKKESFINNLNSFKEDVTNLDNFNHEAITTTALKKYQLSLESQIDQTLNPTTPEFDIEQQDMSSNKTISETTQENDENKYNENLSYDYQTTENNNNDQQVTSENKNAVSKDANTNNEENNKASINNEQISTLYSLSSDIETSCDEFCELKKEISEAIVETQNLINKVQEKEIELTKEQRMFITEQSLQLKALGRQLSNVTTELTFNLSDLNQIMTTNSQDIDNLNLKYLVVLDNLVNGNEMLQSSLASLNLINQMFNMTNQLPSNNQGRILYGFKHNDNPAVIKDFYIDENGELVENNTSNNAENVEENTNADNEKHNTDTYKKSLLESNIDTYINPNQRNNIDTFFNTALLDNDFMYGNGGYGYASGMNPYYNQFHNNTMYRGANNYNTQYNEQQKTTNTNQKQTKEKRKLKLKKNIDTYKDENEPDIKVKIANIKTSINDFFGKFKKDSKDDSISNKIQKIKTELN